MSTINESYVDQAQALLDLGDISGAWDKLAEGGDNYTIHWPIHWLILCRSPMMAQIASWLLMSMAEPIASSRSWRCPA